MFSSPKTSEQWQLHLPGLCARPVCSRLINGCLTAQKDTYIHIQARHERLPSRSADASPRRPHAASPFPFEVVLIRVATARMVLPKYDVYGLWT